MQLSYRGIAYTPASATLPTPTVISGRYRGVPFESVRSLAAPVHHNYPMSFKGVPYSGTERAIAFSANWKPQYS